MTPYNTLWLGIKTNQQELYKKIDKRLQQRLRQGMIKEVSMLHSPPFKGGARGGRGLSWQRMESLGLEYKYLAQFLQKHQETSLPLRGRAREGWKQDFKTMTAELSFAIKHYSKRQLTWWKRNKDIHWIKPPQAAKLVEKFLK